MRNGVWIEHETNFSSCWKVDFGGDDALLTCAHPRGIANGHESDGQECDPSYYVNVGASIYQDSQYFGDVENGSIYMDIAVIKRDSGSSLSGISSSVYNQTGTIQGHVTEDGLADLKSSNRTIYHQGLSTCKTSGTVNKYNIRERNCQYDGNHNPQYPAKWVEVSTHTEPGDSGGPHYDVIEFNNQKYLYLIAPHYGGSSASYGCSAYYINDYSSPITI